MEIFYFLIKIMYNNTVMTGGVAMVPIAALATYAGFSLTGGAAIGVTLAVNLCIGQCSLLVGLSLFNAKAKGPSGAVGKFVEVMPVVEPYSVPTMGVRGDASAP